MSRPLTARQARCLELIRTHYLTHGYAPTLRWLAVEMGMRGGPSGPISSIRALIKKGYLREMPSARSGTRRHNGQPAMSYLPLAEVVVQRLAGGVRVCSVGAVTFTKGEWRAWLRGQLAVAR